MADIHETKGPAVEHVDSEIVNTHTVGYGDGLSAKNQGAKVEVVHNADMFAAIQESQIRPWSKESIHLYFAIFVAFLCACANGYDGSLMTGVLDMTYFQSTFHSGTDGGKVSVIFSLYTVGSMVGAPLAAIISDKLGRRKGMFIGGCVIILGSIIAASGHTIAQLVVGRFVLGFGIAIMTVAAPAYAMEIAPAQWRGRCTGFYNCGWFGGSIPAACIIYGCQNIKSDWSWRIPVICQCFASVVVMVCVFFIPESPRYLMANDRQEEALAFLVKYHGNGKPNDRLVLLEMEEMRENIRIDGIDKSLFDYRPIFLTHNGRWRFAQVMMISVFGQFSGNGLGYFNTVIFANIGVKTVSQQLGYNILTSVVSAIGAITAVCLTDRMYRRTVLVWGTLACSLILAINGGLSTMIAKQTATGDVQGSYARGALAAYMFFNIIYSFTYTPLQGVIPAEALETTMRAKGLAASGVMVNGIGFINQFAGPYALKNIKNNYMYVFVGWDFIESILWYFFCVESQGRTLEELEWVYNQKNPVQASKHVDKVIVQADGTVTEKIVDDISG